MYGCLMIMISALLIGAAGTPTEQPDGYNVSRTEAVEAENGFVFHLQHSVRPTQVWFAVRLRHTEPVDDVDAAQTGRAFLQQKTNRDQSKSPDRY